MKTSKNFFFKSVACGLESLNKEIERNIIDEVHDVTGEECPVKIKPELSTLGSNIEIEPDLKINFNQDNFMRDISGFNPCIRYDKNILSPNPVVRL